MKNRLDILLENIENSEEFMISLLSQYIDTIASSDLDARAIYKREVGQVLTQWKGAGEVRELFIKVFEAGTTYYATEFQKCLDITEEILVNYKDDYSNDIKGGVLLLKGNSLRSFGELDKAFEAQIEALRIINPEGPMKLTFAYANYQLGELLLSSNDPESALEYYKAGLKIAETTNDKTARFRLNNGLGNCYIKLNQLEDSQIYLEKALKVEGLSEAEQARGYCDLGVYFIESKEYSEAKKALESSLDKRDRFGLEDAACTSLIHLGALHVLMEDYANAVEYLERGLKTADEYKSTGKKIQLLKWLALAYEGIGELNKAIRYFKEYDKLNTEVKVAKEKQILRFKNNLIEDQRQELAKKNTALSNTLDELARVKTSRRSLMYSAGTAIILVILSETLLDPVIESVAYNQYISLGVKVIIALMLKPMESIYERILMRRALTLKHK